jgi:hypothetical protein
MTISALSRPYDDEPMTTPATTPSRRRRRRWPWVVGALLVLIAWGAFTAKSLNDARKQAQAGNDQLEHARDVLTPTGLVRGEGIDVLQRASRDFSSARDKVRSPLVLPLKFLPVVGRQVRSVESLTSAAAEVVDAGVDAIKESRVELNRTKPRGNQRVMIVERLGAISAHAHRRIAGVDLGPSNALVGPLQNARARFQRELRKLQDATARSTEASRGLAAFLKGPSTYLVFAANNNEMRVGSGTFLSAGVLHVRDGVFTLGTMTPTQEFMLPPGAVTLTGDFAQRWGWLQPSQEWRNLASSPLFPTQGALAAKMWSALGQPPIDGVLALDPVSLKALIQATHPVVVDGKQYGPNNVLEEIYLDQYAGIVGYPDNLERRDRLSQIARAAIQNLEGDFSTADLADALRNAAQGRHILAWSREPEEQKGWVAAGIDGSFGVNSLMLGVHNRGGNKLDQFLDIKADLTTKTDAKGTAVTIGVRLRNRAPTGLPQYVAGPYPQAKGSKEGLYQGLLVAELPSLARDFSITGSDGKKLPAVTIGRDQNAWVVASYVEAARDATVRATVHFRLPRGADALSVEPSARVPAIEWKYGRDEWRDEGPHDIAW